jgi:hypothetical protein
MGMAALSPPIGDPRGPVAGAVDAIRQRYDASPTPTPVQAVIQEDGMSNTRPPGIHQGPDRRTTPDRRKTSDRRDEIRFEPQKDDRRNGKDRRRHGGWDDTPIR